MSVLIIKSKFIKLCKHKQQSCVLSVCVKRDAENYDIQSVDIGACISQGAREPCEIFYSGTEE